MERARLEEELVLHHEDAWGWALSCCLWDRESAGEVLQDAYLRILEGRARFARGSSFRTWLFGVIRVVALEHRREHARRAAMLERFGAGGAPDPSSRSMPAERAEAAERAGRLRDALAQLPERQREVLHLVFYQGMTIARAAEVMGVGVGTARTHYTRGKRALRTALAALWEA